MRRPLTLAVLLLTVALGACGTRGPLTLPPPRTKPPATPVTPAEPVAVDLNTTKESAR